MSLVEYTEYLVKNLVSDPDMIKVKDFEWKEQIINGDLKIENLKLLYDRIEEDKL